MKKSTIAVGLTALALVLAACDGSSSTADAAQADSGPADAAQADATQEGPAQIGDTVHLGEADITTSNLRNAGVDVFGDNQVCADVTVVNVSESDVVSLNPFDWKLTDTNGVMLSTEFGGATDYDSVELTPGGSKSGTLCFKSDAAPGEYTLTYEKSFSFTSKPTEWKGAL
ncbi:DUF4352 domain-containing protein [Corynebacterium freneyi]|uniref:DUF4352 domain-containing protein n=1 Tax=Corynebacterium freneyi TaxID=134034 RepID=UPI00396CFFE1